MGVTHKLKDNIIKFILDQKQQNPSISCRKLVDIIQESFKIHVSKSSINTVLKEAHLSNPVGRIPRQALKTPKFKIPEGKKTELFEKAKPTLQEVLNIANSSVSEEQSVREEKNAPGIIPPKVFPPTVIEKSAVVEKFIEETQPVANTETASEESVEKKEQSFLLPDPLLRLTEDPMSNIETNPKNTNESKKIEVLDLGNLFIRAAMWDLSRRPFLENFLKHNTAFSDEDIKIIDTMMCFSQPVFDVPSKALEYGYSWLWQVSGFDQPPSLERLDEVVKRLNDTEIDNFDLLMEVDYLFEFAHELKIILRDHSIISLDPRISFFGPGIKNSCPMDLAVEKVSEFMTDRNMPLNLRCSSLEDALIECYNLAAFCQNLPNKEVQKIILCNLSGEMLSEFEHIPNFKRNFFVSIQIQAQKFKELLKIQNLILSTEQQIFKDNKPKLWTIQAIKIPLSSVDEDSFEITGMFFADSLESEIYQGLLYPSSLKLEPSEAYGIMSEPILEIKLTDINKDKALPEGANNLLNCLNALKGVIRGYAERLFPSFFPSHSISECCNAIYIKNDSISVELKQHSHTQPEAMEMLERNLKYYKIRTYEKKPLEFLFKI
jgi:hypothetical protein